MLIEWFLAIPFNMVSIVAIQVVFTTTLMNGI